MKKVLMLSLSITNFAYGACPYSKDKIDSFIQSGLKSNVSVSYMLSTKCKDEMTANGQMNSFSASVTGSPIQPSSSNTNINQPASAPTFSTNGVSTRSAFSAPADLYPSPVIADPLKPANCVGLNCPVALGPNPSNAAAPAATAFPVAKTNSAFTAPADPYAYDPLSTNPLLKNDNCVGIDCPVAMGRAPSSTTSPVFKTNGVDAKSAFAAPANSNQFGYDLNANDPLKPTYCEGFSCPPGSRAPSAEEIKAQGAANNNVAAEPGPTITGTGTYHPSNFASQITGQNSNFSPDPNLNKTYSDVANGGAASASTSASTSASAPTPTAEQATAAAESGTIAAATATATGAVDYKSCLSILDSAKGAEQATGQNQQLDGQNGSDTMRQCVKLSKGKMRSIYNASSRSDFHWISYIDAAVVEKCSLNASACSKEDQDPQIRKCINNSLDENHQLAANCESAAFLINSFGRDWTSEEDVRTETVKGGNPEVRCRGMGVETLDYAACVKFVQNGEVMDAAQMMAQSGQELYYKSKAMDAQVAASNSGNSATGALEAMKSGVQDQKSIMEQRATMDSAKLAALSKYYSELPDASEINNRCGELTRTDSLFDVKSLQQTCVSTVNNNLFAYLQNQKSKGQMKTRLIALGINVGGNLVMADMMGKRAGQIDGAIANVNAFKPIDPVAAPLANVQTTFCQMNPTDPQCLTGGLNRTFDTTGNNVISFGDGGTGVAYNNSNPFLNNGGAPGTTNNAVSPNAANRVGTIGGAITSASQGAGLVGVAAKADVTNGKAPGGGGGGGSAGGGGGGGGGGGAPGAGNPGGVSAAIAGKAPTYGGGSGTLSAMGGFGINKSKATAKADGNPFGKLFNKGNNSGALNFGRSPASDKMGNKADNIFEMISKRYTSVNGDKRLLEYELAK